MDASSSVGFYAVSTSIWLASEVAAIVVAFVFVAPRSRAAAGLMVASVGMALSGWVVDVLGSFVVARSLDATRFLAFNNWKTLGMALWGAVTGGVFLVGLVRLSHAVSETLPSTGGFTSPAAPGPTGGVAGTGAG